MLVNTSLAIGKSLKAMKSKIEKLNKKIGQFKVETDQKDKIMIELKNHTSELLAKMIKQEIEYDKSLQESKVESVKL